MCHYPNLEKKIEFATAIFFIMLNSLVGLPDTGLTVVWHWSDCCLTQVWLLSDTGLAVVWHWSNYCLRLVWLLSDIGLTVVWHWSNYCLIQVWLLSDTGLTVVWHWPNCCMTLMWQLTDTALTVVLHWCDCCLTLVQPLSDTGSTVAWHWFNCCLTLVQLLSDTGTLVWLFYDTDEKHLRSDSRAASQRLGILRKSWRVLHDRSLLGRSFRGFILPVLEYYSAVWCWAADTHFEQLDRSVSCARFLTVGVLECDIAHRRSVAVFLCMLYKIRCNLVHLLNGALLQDHMW